MKAKRRKFTAAFKAQVTIEALKVRETMAVLFKRVEVHLNMISKWKSVFLERSAEIFETAAPRENFEAEREKLFAKIGQLEIERVYLNRKRK